MTGRTPQVFWTTGTLGPGIYSLCVLDLCCGGYPAAVKSAPEIIRAHWRDMFSRELPADIPVRIEIISVNDLPATDGYRELVRYMISLGTATNHRTTLIRIWSPWPADAPVAAGEIVSPNTPFDVLAYLQSRFPG